MEAYQQIENKSLYPPNWGPVGYVTYKRTYARRLDEDNPDSETEEWVDTLNRVLAGCKRQLKCGFTEKEEKEVFDLLYNLKFSVAGRFLWQLNTPTVDRLGLASLQNCFAKETEFLTKDGIKSFSSFKQNDPVIIRGKGKWISATVKCFGKQPIVKLTVRKGKRLEDFYCTKNHRWNIKLNKCVIKTTDELKKGEQFVSFTKKTNFHCIQMCPIGIQHGIVYGGGNKRSMVDNCAITLCGDKKVLSKYFFTPRKDNREITGLPNTWKDLPSIHMSKEYLYGFLAGWFSADGYIAKNGSNITLSNKDPEVLNWARSALSILDITSSQVNMSRKTNPFNGEDNQCYRITIDRDVLPKEFFLRQKHIDRYKVVQQKNYWRVESVVDTDRVEDVWCVVEPLKEEFTLSNGILTKNCAFRKIDHPIDPFTWAFDMLMLGSGVGFNVQHKYVCKLPPLKAVNIKRLDTKDADFIVPDSREGWTKLMGKVLKAHFYSGEDFTYSTMCLRSKGAPIKSFGGLASGPESLCHGVNLINTLLNKRANSGDPSLHPIDAVDIIDIIGMIVVSGNVRRSAILVIGDPFDLEYLRAKRWDLGGIPNWRAYSNNSVACSDISELPEEFWEGYKGNGEPYGLINIPLSRKIGRLGETQYPDPDVCGFNP